MKIHRWTVLILSMSFCGALAQTNRQAEFPRTGIPRSQSLESREGYPKSRCDCSQAHCEGHPFGMQPS